MRSRPSGRRSPEPQVPAAAVTSRAELSIPADTTGLRQASSWLESEAAAQGVPPEQRLRLDHCLDEALANVLAHGGDGARRSPIQLQFHVCRYPGTAAAELTLIDSGVAFDPRTAPARGRPLPGSLSEARPGGLGLVMMRSFSDQLDYRLSEGRNHLTFTVRWSEAT